MNEPKSMKRKLDWQGIAVLSVLISLVLSLIFWVFNECNPDRLFCGDEYELIGFFGGALTLLVAAWGIGVADKRATALDKTATAAMEGNRQERYRDAITHLGDEKASVRQGGAHTLFQMALENAEERALRVSIAEILCSHIREVTRDKKYQEEYEEKPSTEIQSLLQMLFTMSEHGGGAELARFWEGIRPDLSDGYFRGLALVGGQFYHARLLRAQFQGAELQLANFQEADLRYAQFHEATLNDAKFIESNLRGAVFQRAKLLGAQFQRAKHFDCPDFRGAELLDANFTGGELPEAKFQGADLSRASLMLANLWQAQFQGAKLHGTQLQGAEPNKAQFQGAELQEAQFQAANLWGAEFQEAEFRETKFQGVCSEQSRLAPFFENRIRVQQDKDSCYAQAIFSGGLDEKRINDFIANLKEAGWDTKEIDRFKARIDGHKEREANHELPDGVVSGKYDKDQADTWIAKYEKDYEEGTSRTLL